MREIDVLQAPKIKRIVEQGWRTEENKKIAKQYGKEFFDGDRINGYGGYYYDGRWRKVARRLGEIYGLNSDSSVLDIGCSKGFLLYDLQAEFPGIKVAGIDISKYAINKAMEKYGIFKLKEKTGKNEQELTPEELKQAEEIENKARQEILPYLITGSADSLPYQDNSFDVVLSINTTHNLPEEKAKQAIREMIRVCKKEGKMFIQVDSYHDDEEKKRMNYWILTAETIKSTEEWLKLFKEVDYQGDYFWTVV